VPGEISERRDKTTRSPFNLAFECEAASPKPLTGKSQVCGKLRL
jgi:hypothetical protein